MMISIFEEKIFTMKTLAIKKLLIGVTALLPVIGMAEEIGHVDTVFKWIGP
jgi:catabolite regulation protein CreA